jgi:hypothetical protein
MTMNPEHADLHRLVDRLDPDQARALRAVGRQLLRPHVEQPGSGETQAAEAESLLADEPVRDFSFIGLLNGAPDLAERSEEILREEFAKPPMPITDTGPLGAMLNAKDRHHEYAPHCSGDSAARLSSRPRSSPRLPTFSRANWVLQSRPRSSTRLRVAG